MKKVTLFFAFFLLTLISCDNESATPTNPCSFEEDYHKYQNYTLTQAMQDIEMVHALAVDMITYLTPDDYAQIGVAHRGLSEHASIHRGKMIMGANGNPTFKMKNMTPVNIVVFSSNDFKKLIHKDVSAGMAFMHKYFYDHKITVIAIDGATLNNKYTAVPASCLLHEMIHLTQHLTSFQEKHIVLPDAAGREYQAWHLQAKAFAMVCDEQTQALMNEWAAKFTCKNNIEVGYDMIQQTCRSTFLPQITSMRNCPDIPRKWIHEPQK